MIHKGFFAAILSVGMVALFIAIVTTSSQVGAWFGISCSLGAKEGRIIIVFKDMGTGYLVSSGSEDQARLGPVSATIPPGIYDVTLASYDNHSDKPDQIQPDERWHIILENSEGGVVATTNSIPDLPDTQDYRTAIVNQHFAINQLVAKVHAFHTAFFNSNPNSIIPVCAAFDRVADRPSVITLPATDIGRHKALVHGYVDPQRSTDTTRWFEWGATPSLGHTTIMEQNGPSASAFSELLEGLTPSTTYYFRAAAQNSVGTVRGAILSFKTKAPKPSPSPSPSLSP